MSAGTRRVLWAANSYWDSPFQVGANHYARALVRRGFEVAFVSEPISPLHFVRRNGRRETLDRFETWRRGGRRDCDGGLFAYTPLALFVPAGAPGLRSRWLLEHWQRATVPDVRRKLEVEGFGAVDLLVVDTVRQAFWLDVVRAAVCVARITDHLAGFAGVTPAMLEREATLIRRAQHVFYTARTLEARVRAAGAIRATYLPNGVDVAAFTREVALPPEFREMGVPRAIYVGAIDRWFDVELLATVARALPQLDIVLIGPVKIDLSPLRRLDNVHVLGARPHAQVPAYLRHAQVGLIPFRADDLVHSVNPIKLYEYAAAGLPVVATRWDEIASLDAPVTLCSGPAEFLAGVRGALDGPPPAAALSDFAAAADWSRRTDRLLAALELA